MHLSLIDLDLFVQFPDWTEQSRIAALESSTSRGTEDRCMMQVDSSPAAKTFRVRGHYHPGIVSSSIPGEIHADPSYQSDNIIYELVQGLPPIGKDANRAAYCLSQFLRSLVRIRLVGQPNP